MTLLLGWIFVNELFFVKKMGSKRVVSLSMESKIQKK